MEAAPGVDGVTWQQYEEEKPETFDFLGFTHICGRTNKGNWFTVRRQTIKKRLRRKLQAVRQELRKRWHERVAEIVDRFLPLPRILHPEPGARFDASHPR